MRDRAEVMVSGELSGDQERITCRAVRKARSGSEKLTEIWSEWPEGQNDA